MDISLAQRSGIIPFELEMPHVKLEAEGVLSLNFVWKLKCRASVTKVASLNAPPLTVLNQIDQLGGSLDLNLTIRVVDGCSSIMASLAVTDVDCILKSIYGILKAPSDKLYVELRFLNQMICFNRFLCDDTGGINKNLLLYSSSPIHAVSPYQVLLFKLDSLRPENFLISAILTYENETVCEDEDSDDDYDDDDDDSE